MKIKHAMTLVLSGILLAQTNSLIANPTNSVVEVGDYSVRTFSSGELGDDNHVSGFEVSRGTKVVLHRVNSNATSDVLVNEGSLRLLGGCLFLCYGEVSDGLDDAYIHAVKLCGERVESFTAVVGDDQGSPVLKIGEIPRDWDKNATKSAIQETFKQIYTRE